jgi:meso-butanediol dehydrogenase/(S,S)-butanediol dehydrogenase/diacetyl reductase
LESGATSQGHGREEDRSLRGRVAVVTGGGRGIGRGIVLALAGEGVDVAVAEAGSRKGESEFNQHHGTEESGLESAFRVVREVEAAGQKESWGSAVALETDVRNRAEVEAMVRDTVSRFGRVDILVNCAGAIWRGPLIGFDEGAWDYLFDVNVKGVFLCCKMAAPLMIGQRWGRIVNVSSVSGKEGSANSSAYCASKFAVIGLTQSLAFELAPYSVTVNAVCPGIVDTAMWRRIISPEYGAKWGVSAEEAFARVVHENIPLGRPQTPEDIGEAVLYLCRSRNVTAQSLNVCGGMVVH